MGIFTKHPKRDFIKREGEPFVRVKQPIQPPLEGFEGQAIIRIDREIADLQEEVTRLRKIIARCERKIYRSESDRTALKASDRDTSLGDVDGSNPSNLEWLKNVGVKL